MADISKIKINNVSYNIKDATARTAIGNIANIPTALAAKVGWADYRTVTESGTTKHYIYFYKDQASAPASSAVPTSSNYLCRIDAADFVKDGMVSNAQVIDLGDEEEPNVVLRITFNTDANHPNPIDIPVTDIFNPEGYLKEGTDIEVNSVDTSSITIGNATITYIEGDSENDEPAGITIGQEAPQPLGSISTFIPLDVVLATSDDIDYLQGQINSIVSDGVGVTDMGYNNVSGTKKIQYYDQSGWHDVASASEIVSDGDGVKGVKMNNSNVSKNASTKVVDLGTVVTGIKINGTTDATVTNGVAAITIPSTAWNDVKPSGGVPKSDLASAVQTSLGKADSAIQGVKVNGTELTKDSNNKVDVTVPTALSQLTADSTHRLVTDDEKTAWNAKQNALTFDNSPTKNSANPVKSGGVYSALADLYDGYDSSTETISFTFPTE